MKRKAEEMPINGDEEGVVDTGVKRPKIRAIEITDPIKHVVETALYNKERGEELSAQPIVLHGRSDHRDCEIALAYWPSDVAIGVKLLKCLNDTQDAADCDTHIELVDTLYLIATGAITKEENKERRDQFDSLMGMENAAGLIGLFAILRDDLQGNQLGEVGAGQFFVNAKELSPHLYVQECFLFEF